MTWHNGISVDNRQLTLKLRVRNYSIKKSFHVHKRRLCCLEAFKWLVYVWHQRSKQCQVVFIERGIDIIPIEYFGIQYYYSARCNYFRWIKAVQIQPPFNSRKYLQFYLLASNGTYLLSAKARGIFFKSVLNDMEDRWIYGREHPWYSKLDWRNMERCCSSSTWIKYSWYPIFQDCSMPFSIINVWLCRKH